MRSLCSTALSLPTTLSDSIPRVLLRLLGPDSLGSGFHLLRLGDSVRFPKSRSVGFKARGHLGVVRSQALLPDRQRALQERLGLVAGLLGGLRSATPTTA